MTELQEIKAKPCDRPCTKVLQLLTDREISANTGMSMPPYTKIDGYRYINIFVKFNQEEADEEPVDLGVIFAFDKNGEMGSRRYVNLENNLGSPQNVQFIEISGRGSWHGSQWKISSYMVRFPVMGPYIEVFVYNRAPVHRKVSVWAYLVS